MKNLLSVMSVLLLFVILVSACGRRNIPSRTHVLKPKITPDRIDNKQYVKPAIVLDSLHNKSAEAMDKQKEIKDSYTKPAAKDTVANVDVPEEAVVVIDSHGELQIDTLHLPSTVSHNLDSIKQAIRAYTPNEAKNLAFRYKEIPPRVLFVPDNLAKKGVKGYYYRYENKFWYWKKDDGFFYLDKNYYR